MTYIIQMSCGFFSNWVKVYFKEREEDVLILGFFLLCWDSEMKAYTNDFYQGCSYRIQMCVFL